MFGSHLNLSDISLVISMGSFIDVCEQISEF